MSDSIFFLSRDKFFADLLGPWAKIRSPSSIENPTSYKDIVINSDSISNLFSNQRVEELVKTGESLTKIPDSAGPPAARYAFQNEQAIYATVDKLLEMPKFKKVRRNLLFPGQRLPQDRQLRDRPWFNWISANQWKEPACASTRARTPISIKTFTCTDTLPTASATSHSRERQKPYMDHQPATQPAAPARCVHR